MIIQYNIKHKSNSSNLDQVHLQNFQDFVPQYHFVNPSHPIIS